jgi:hypothetical protein
MVCPSNGVKAKGEDGETERCSSELVPDRSPIDAASTQLAMLSGLSASALGCNLGCTLVSAPAPAPIGLTAAAPEAYHNPAAVWWGLRTFRPHVDRPIPPHCQLGKLCRPGLSHSLTCEAGYPRVTVRDPSSPGLMAR